MIRHAILIHPHFVIALLVAAVLLPVPARAQDRTVDDRLDRIERDLNMLERQVYRGAPTAMGAPPAGSPNSAVSIEIRMEQLETQMRDLTGKVEEIANGLDQLKQRVEQINSDFDVRFEQMTGEAPAAPARSAANGSPKLAGAGSPPQPALLVPQPGTVVPPPAAGPAPIFNTLTPPGAAPVRQPPAALTEPASTDAPLPAGSVNEQFNHAFGLIKQRDYAGAETALKAFIQQHPGDPLAGSAQYWLGETYFVRNQYADAIAAFAEGYRRYPKGPKAPETLLDLGRSLARADQKKNACIALVQLEQLPNSSAAIKERAGAEKKRIGCS